jgi:hypothetical protein
MIDCCIPLKDRLLVELIRSAVCWVIWLERNNILFRGAIVSSIRSLRLRIIHLTIFWCTVRNASQLLNLTLILLQGVYALPFQVEDLCIQKGDLIEAEETRLISTPIFG